MTDQTQRVFLFKLPVLTNDGAPYEASILNFEQVALNLAGGFTKGNPQVGAWRGSDGRVYTDSVLPYEIATDYQTYGELLAAAFKLFPDQAAIYTAVQGEPLVVNAEPGEVIDGEFSVVASERITFRVESLDEPSTAVVPDVLLAADLAAERLEKAVQRPRDIAWRIRSLQRTLRLIAAGQESVASAPTVRNQLSALVSAAGAVRVPA